MTYKIKDITIDNPIVLAPMAGVCNAAFRSIIKRFGAGLVYAEMVSDKAVVYQNKKTLNMLYVAEDEHPMAMQIFGGDKETFIEAAKFVDANCDCDIIDINMGCPVPKVTKNEAGAKLLLDSDKIYDIVSSINAVTTKPVTVKMRIGWNADTVNVINNAKAVEAAGASAVAIHGRTAKQMYTGKADWSYVKQVVEAVNIPVFGNGDIKTPEDVKMRLEETGAQGIMIGRAFLGNPWLAAQINEYLTTGTYRKEIPAAEKFMVAKEHMRELKALKGEHLAVLEMRGHMAWYIKGLKGSSRVKELLMQQKTEQGMISILDEYAEWLDAEN